MRYKVGDKVRVRGDLEVDEQYGSEIFTNSMEKFLGKIYEIGEEKYEAYWLKEIVQKEYQNFCFSDEMLRPAEFKIWCETEEEKRAVLEELEKEGYVWWDDCSKPTKSSGKNAKCGLYVSEDRLSISYDDDYYIRDDRVEITPSEFTGIDFSEQIIITKTPTGATASYGDKTVTAEGDFEDASRQALAEVLCPFKVGDRVKDKATKRIGTVEKIYCENHIIVDYETSGFESDYPDFGKLDPYTELYNAKLFCIKGSGTFEQGVVYTVENGVFTGIHGSHFKNLDDINEHLIAQFMEVKGGLDD